jgi:predicted amidohydrolase
VTATLRIALANLRYPESPEAAIARAVAAVHEAAARGAALVVFPECYVPGYRWPTREVPPPDAAYLERAWNAVADAAAQASIMVVLGTERITDAGVMLTALVINERGERVGWQDKVQLDPSEENGYVPATDRRLFTVRDVPFGIVICHEGWRYPETVRWAARQGAQLVVHPHYGEAEPGSYQPRSYGDPRNSFHEAAVRCRAAENTIWFATVNCAGEGSPTTSAVASPDGTIVAWQPYGDEGLLVVDCDLTPATRLLASRCRTPLPALAATPS